MKILKMVTVIKHMGTIMPTESCLIAGLHPQSTSSESDYWKPDKSLVYVSHSVGAYSGFLAAFISIHI